MRIHIQHYKFLFLIFFYLAYLSHTHSSRQIQESGCSTQPLIASTPDTQITGRSRGGRNEDLFTPWHFMGNERGARAVMERCERMRSGCGALLEPPFHLKQTGGQAAGSRATNPPPTPLCISLCPMCNLRVAMAVNNTR